MPYVDGEFLTDDEYNDWMGFTEENGDGDDDDREDEPRTWTQPWTTDASAGAPPSVHEQGPVNALTPEQHLAYQLFMLENPGDAHRASDALEFDTREAREEAPGDEGVPGAFVTQYHKQTKGPWQQDGETQDPRDPADLAAALIIDRDRGSWEQRLKEEARKAGSTYDPSDLEGIIRNFSYAANAGQDPQQMIDAQIGIYQTRGASGGERDEGGYSTRWADDDPRRWTYGGAPPPGYTGRAWIPPPVPAPAPSAAPPLYSGQPPGGGASGAGGRPPPLAVSRAFRVLWDRGPALRRPRRPLRPIPAGRRMKQRRLMRLRRPTYREPMRLRPMLRGCLLSHRPPSRWRPTPATSFDCSRGRKP